MVKPRRATLVLVAVVGGVGFVVLRVLYRIIFGGTSGGETTLWALPTTPLWGPFSHIVIGGSVTTEGLLSSAISALPFAAVIVLSGVLIAAVDPRSLLLVVPKLLWGRSIVLAFVIALATLPFIVTTYRVTRRNALRRGLKPGRMLLLPVLEKTLERATGIAWALESRGIHARRRRSEVAPRGPVFLEALSIPSRGLHNISWSVAPGAHIVLTGATGSGKTTLLEALARVLPDNAEEQPSGTLSTGCDAAAVGYLPHQPHFLFLASTVLDEVALASIYDGVAISTAREEAHLILNQWDVASLATQHPATLSSGEAVVVALAALCVTHPQVLLLDEPLQTLDPTWRARIVEHLAHLPEQETTVIVTDHGNRELEAWGGAYMTLSETGLAPGTYIPPAAERPSGVPAQTMDADDVFMLGPISVSYGKKTVLDAVSLTLRRGQTVVLSGDNGSGKTTLLEKCADSAENGPAQIALVPSDPSNLFMKESVAEELALADTVAGVEKGFTRHTLEAILSGPWRAEMLAQMKDTHPRDLSRGQQTALALALQMSHKPLVLALDEPTRGLDSAAIQALHDVLGCVKETGTALLIASHEAESFHHLAERRLTLSRGVLVEAQEVAK